jgi:hypothetical protein
MVERIVAYRILMGKPVRKRALERLRRRKEDNNKMSLPDGEHGLECSETE